MMLREHILQIVASSETPSNTAMAEAARLNYIEHTARLIDAYDALRSDLSAAEHLLHEATTGAEQVNAELAALRSELAAATERLWKTADGVYAQHGDTVYHPSTPSAGMCRGNTSSLTVPTGASIGKCPITWITVPTSECYSSREAMEAAKGGA